MFRRITLSLLLACSGSVFAQKQSLTDEQYFKNSFKDIVSPLPAAVKWNDNSHFQYMKNGKVYVMDAKTGVEREMTDADKPATPVKVKPAVFLKGNDLYLKTDSAEIRLTNDEAKESNPVISPDGNYVAYTKKNDLYTVDLSKKNEIRLTSDGSEVILNGYASWVYMEEILGRASQYRAFWWSPDSKHIAFFRTDDSPVPVYTITDGNGQHGYLETIRYPKVGDPNPQVKVGMIAPSGGRVIWAEFNPMEDQYFGLPYWKPDGKTLLVQWMNRKQNNLKIWEVDPSNGMKTLFLHEEQPAWISLDDEGDRIHFLENGNGFILMSDVSGFKQMYHYDLKGQLVSRLNPGKYAVTELNHIDTKNNVVYFTAKKENSAHKDLYRVNLDGTKLQRLTFGDYHHYSISLSPDASYFITTYSNVSTPPKMAVVNNSGKLIREFADNKGPRFENVELAKTEIIRVMSDDSLFSLPMKVTWPLNMDKGKKYPVLISIYGGPEAGTVMDNWALNGNQQWYAKEGMIQVAMDHRASGHFGKKGADFMYHNLGYWEMKDYTTMVKWLIANGNADPAKICITGFSYGGYLSCYALTYGAETFTHGMAGGSVTDWSLYDTHYTERFMGTLTDNPEGYKSSSVLTHTGKYKGMLQIVHGVIDENVHMQNSIQLISKLQDEKKDFEFMLYSGGRHGWQGNKQSHFQNLKTKFIYRYLLEKTVPAGLLK
jgi:dipeptidyl-peptidase-4